MYLFFETILCISIFVVFFLENSGHENGQQDKETYVLLSNYNLLNFIHWIWMLCI